MIGHLQGTVVANRAGYVILSAGGVGYKVSATRESLARLIPGEQAAVWTHLVVREDALDLYGFFDEEELTFFNHLLSVSGIGPKSALSILDISSVETLRTAISTGESSYLTTIAGIGKKTAEKIVLELRDKVGAAIEGGATALKGDSEALEAMRALGYSLNEARDALRKVPSSIESTKDRLREAIKIMGER